MHEQWQDLIPYYVAGSLSQTDAAALERHVEFCALCRKALDEWRVIGRIINLGLIEKDRVWRGLFVHFAI